MGQYQSVDWFVILPNLVILVKVKLRRLAPLPGERKQRGARAPERVEADAAWMWMRGGKLEFG